MIYNFQFNDGNCGVRLRYDPLSSELVEGKMVLKIVKPPRNKDSLSSLTAQSFSWVFNVSVCLNINYNNSPAAAVLSLSQI